uniref:Guanine nucleotide-binding protein subunit gamma n=1 Tax=Glossina morsitans morsitans TaxID=37546 RepID=A0A1B0GE82_GLOMM
MDPSALQNMDRDALKKQIENMKYQASMERWPLSKSIAEYVSNKCDTTKTKPRKVNHCFL